MYMLGSHPIKNESLTIRTLTDLDKRNIYTTYDYDRLLATRINERLGMLHVKYSTHCTRLVQTATLY